MAEDFCAPVMPGLPIIRSPEPLETILSSVTLLPLAGPARELAPEVAR